MVITGVWYARIEYVYEKIHGLTPIKLDRKFGVELIDIATYIDNDEPKIGIEVQITEMTSLGGRVLLAEKARRI